jgi:hypothetical protein
VILLSAGPEARALGEHQFLSHLLRNYGKLGTFRQRRRCTPVGSFRYCLSYTALLVNFLPKESVPEMFTVRPLPSAETTILPLVMILPFSLPATSMVCALMTL